MKEIFDNYIETTFDGLEQAPFKIEQFKLNYRRYFPQELAGAVLDIGVGRGEMLTCMRDWGFNYHGIDISPSTIRFCQSLGLNCELVANAVDWLVDHAESFSIVTCLDVLEHIPREQVIGFLSAMRSSLRTSGRIIIQVPNLQSPFGYLHHFNDFTHVSGFVEHSLGQVLIAGGFKRFSFHGFEEIYRPGVKAGMHKIARAGYRAGVRFLRRVNSNPNPDVLDPVMYVVAER